ncbi:MAG: hypothetical protein RLZZ511_4009 [Cyanobacteriota bacterium]
MRTFFVGFVGACARSGCDIFGGIFEGEAAVDEVELDLAEGVAFAEFALGELGVELGHEEAGGGIVDFPEGGEDGFGFAFVAEEVGGDSGDFEAVAIAAAKGGFAGGEDDEVNVIEVGEVLDLGNLEGGAVAEDEEGLAGFGGDEFAVGGEVEDVGGLGEEAVFEAFAGEVTIEPSGAGEAARG